MRQLAGQHHLALEAREIGRIVLIEHQLDRRWPPHHGVVRLIDLAHPALPQLLAQLIVAQRLDQFLGFGDPPRRLLAFPRGAGQQDDRDREPQQHQPEHAPQHAERTIGLARRLAGQQIEAQIRQRHPGRQRLDAARVAVAL